jgi:hypothetical protein
MLFSLKWCFLQTKWKGYTSKTWLSHEKLPEEWRHQALREPNKYFSYKSLTQNITWFRQPLCGDLDKAIHKKGWNLWWCKICKILDSHYSRCNCLVLTCMCNCLNCNQQCYFIRFICYAFTPNTRLNKQTSCIPTLLYKFPKCSVCDMHTIRELLSIQTLHTALLRYNEYLILNALKIICYLPFNLLLTLKKCT